MLVFLILLPVKFCVLRRIKIIVELDSVNVVVFNNFGYSVGDKLCNVIKGGIEVYSAVKLNCEVRIFYIRVIPAEGLGEGRGFYSVRIYPGVNFETVLMQKGRT